MFFLRRTLVNECMQYEIGFGRYQFELFFLSGLPLFLAVLVDAIVSKGDQVSLLSYAIGEFIPLTTGAQLAFAMMDVFVPLVSCSTRSARVADSREDRTHGRGSPRGAHRRDHRRRDGVVRAPARLCAAPC